MGDDKMLRQAQRHEPLESLAEKDTALTCQPIPETHQILESEDSVNTSGDVSNANSLVMASLHPEQQTKGMLAPIPAATSAQLQVLNGVVQAFQPPSTQSFPPPHQPVQMKTYASSSPCPTTEISSGATTHSPSTSVSTSIDQFSHIGTKGVLPGHHQNQLQEFQCQQLHHQQGQLIQNYLQQGTKTRQNINHPPIHQNRLQALNSFKSGTDTRKYSTKYKPFEFPPLLQRANRGVVVKLPPPLMPLAMNDPLWVH